MESTTQQRRFSCDNHSNSVSCPAEGKFTCKGCSLVLYCGVSCQKEHWIHHKKDCKSPYTKSDWTPSWHVENRLPAFINSQQFVTFGGKKYLWGNIPAIDVLALKNNEGSTYEKELNLLFAASGDLRNVVKTIAALPLTYTQQVTITMNDRDLDIVARNAIMLILLLAVEDTEAAIDCVLHIWYSAQISEVHLALLSTTVQPLIKDICTKISQRPDSKLQGKTWSFSNRRLRLVLTKQAWNSVLSYLDPPAGLTSQQANSIRLAVTMAPERKDYLERYLFAHPPARRLGTLRYRQDGILLPFGHSRNAHSIPNPTFFQNSTSWPLKDSADPIEGWLFKDILDTFAGGASHDIYGKLYYLVKDTLTSFRERLQLLDVSFNLFNLDARKELSKHLSIGTFARIEVSNICDAGYVGPAATVGIFTPFLQNPTINPHATLITLFMNAVEEEFQNFGGAYDIQVMAQEMSLVTKYMPDIPNLNTNDPYFLKVSHAKSSVRDGDRYFKKYMERMQFPIIVQKAKANMRQRNSIVEKWPYRLKLRPGQPGAREEFDNAVAGGLTGTECYLEWYRTE